MRGKSRKEAAVSRWESQWRKQFELLGRFRARHGRWPKVSESFPPGNRLGQWANRQRELRARGELSPERVALLRKAGFSWDRRDERELHWVEQFEHLKAFRKQNPRRWPYARQEFPKGNRLGLWVWRQRQSFAQGALPSDRRERLERIGFPFELPDAWEEQFRTLKQYRAKHPGRWPKAREEFPAGKRLGLWCHLQRCAYKVGKLSSDRTSRLERIGFQWSVKQVNWMRFYDMLKNYKKKHRDKWPVLEAAALEDRRVIAWCSMQRHKRRLGKLEKERVALLDKLGFRW